jgi:predicted SAM-dependent methyltransferase
MLKKFGHYSREQSVLHASFAGLGRKAPGIWYAAGPRLTSSAFRRYKARTEDAAMMLNLGGGSYRIDGAFNVDIDPRADAFVDLTKPLPFPDRTYRYIFCEEVLEHVDQQDGLAMLMECYRILKPGGVLRITTPDLGYFARNAVENDLDGREINLIFYGHGHKHIYSRASLQDAMSDAGFENMTFSEYQDKGSTLGKLDSHADRFDHSPEISLYCEGSRPTGSA